MKRCLWLILGGFVFLVSFYSTTILLSVIYPPGSALLAF